MDLDNNGRSDFLDDFEDQMAMSGYKGIYGGPRGHHNDIQQEPMHIYNSYSEGSRSVSDSSLLKMIWNQLVGRETKKKIFKITAKIFFGGLVVSAVAIFISLL